MAGVFLEIRQDFCVKTPCQPKRSLALGHIPIFQTRPGRERCERGSIGGRAGRWMIPAPGAAVLSQGGLPEYLRRDWQKPPH